MKTIILEGSKIHDLSTFYDETQRKFCPSLKGYGRNLDAFNDVLSGGFLVYEYDENVRLIWEDSNKSREALSYDETLKYLHRKLTKCHPSWIEKIQQDINLAEKNQGQTLFDIIIEIINRHKHIDFVLD